MNILLSGIVGSTAYGLAGPDSDVDTLGVYAVNTIELHGLHSPDETVAHHGPDETYHEARKYCSLALRGNPTIMELLWLDEEFYTTRTALGDELIGIRQAFLSPRRVRDAYLGYATQQFRRLENRGDGSFSADTRKRTAKHARHLARLLVQGEQLYAEGRLTVRLQRPDAIREFGDRVAEGDLDLPRRTIAETEYRFDMLTSPLPNEPDVRTVEAWLRRVRLSFLVSSGGDETRHPRPCRSCVRWR